MIKQTHINSTLMSCKLPLYRLNSCRIRNGSMFSAAAHSKLNKERTKPMPGGVGPVSNSTLSAGTARDRKITSAKNATEIFYNLNNLRVFYDSADSHLYFIDTPDGLVTRWIDEIARLPEDFRTVGESLTPDQLAVAYRPGGWTTVATSSDADAVPGSLASRHSTLPPRPTEEDPTGKKRWWQFWK